MYMMLLIFAYMKLLFMHQTVALYFEEITNDMFEDGEYSGFIAAFGYFNSDKLTDVFCLQKDGKQLEVLLGSEEKPYLRKSGISCAFENNFISSVVPGDYDGDSKMDILITLPSSANENEVKILWGSTDSVDCKSESIATVQNQPFVVDFNADMIPDVIGELKNGTRVVWISNGNKTFTVQPHAFNRTHSQVQNFRKPHSSGFLDLNNDLASDILITGNESIELWYNKGKEFILKSPRPYPMIPGTNKLYPVIGQSSFVDINLNGVLDHIIPVCYDQKCDLSAILVWDYINFKWVTLVKKFILENDTLWGFKLPLGDVKDQAALQITLHAGDVDMDGYPDFVGVLQSKTKATDVRAVVFQNVPCSDCFFGRGLEVQKLVPGLDAISGVQIVAFFDIFEDGFMDILVSTRVKNMWKIQALKNVDSYDACFMKVLVLSGLCKDNCSSNYFPYGPGPMIRYNMTKQDGTPVVSCAVQMSQSAYFPLQLPYTVFGLGQTPNFIDALTIAIPRNLNEKVRKRDWTQIIPNSQMVVIPYPPNEEYKWVKKLFVTPSHLVLLTCIALIVTCSVIAVLVGCLHWKERKEDKKEKMQDAHRFHFDAM